MRAKAKKATVFYKLKTYEPFSAKEMLRSEGILFGKKVCVYLGILVVNIVELINRIDWEKDKKEVVNASCFRERRLAAFN